MSVPQRQSQNANANRRGFRKFYRIALIAYWPCLFVLGYIFDIIGNSSFLDVNLWEGLLLALILTLPAYLCFVTVGQLVLFLISEKSKILPAPKYKNGLILRIVGIALSVILWIVVYILTL